ncbi:MAG: pantoate--beta-alanine ligase [Acidobacteriota bacterium]
METIETVSRMKRVCREEAQAGKTIGLVPTMGYWHEGHLSLIRAARKRCQVVVVSVFVNPMQFGPQEDYRQYPRDLSRDIRLAKAEGVDYLFYPSVEEMYPQGFKTEAEVRELSDTLCGKSRPGHFKGVATVVLKLFNIVRPDAAFFGQKDAQQALIIKRMIDDLNLDVELVILPIVREEDGLAMSSRNLYLNSQERRAAAILYKSLQKARELVLGGERRASVIISHIQQIIEQEPLARVDYISLTDAENLREVDIIEDKVLIALAVFIGKTRLIDNLLLDVSGA